MGIHVHWDNPEKTILVETFEGNWTLDDYHRMIDAAAALLAQEDHPVHVICDGTQSKTLPSQMLSGVRYAIKKMPQNQGIVVFVNANMFAKTIINIAKKLTPLLVNTIEYADSVEAARAIIAKKSQINS
jgi:hypothetical protein